MSRNNQSRIPSDVTKGTVIEVHMRFLRPGQMRKEWKMASLRNGKTGSTRGVIAAMLMLCLGVASCASATTPDHTVKCRVELDRDVLPVGEGETAIVKVTLAAPDAPRHLARPPINMSIVLDRSGSMNGRKLDKAKTAAIEALRRLSANDMFSLVTYDHNVETIVPAQSAANTEWIEGRIRQISSGGNTALFGGVSQGAAEIRKHLDGGFVHRIVLLSDGLANVGPSSPADLGRLGAALIKEGIAVTTIGVGTDYNEDLMAHLSQNSDGNTYFVEDSGDLARIFNEELGDVLSIVAKKVKIVIECPEGVTPVRLIGREGRIRSRQVELYLNQLYGGQEKFALLEVDLPVASDGDRREIAVASVSYSNPFTQRYESVVGRVVGKFSRSKNEVERSANSSVHKAHGMNLNAVAQGEAIRLADEGKTSKASAVLKTSASKLRYLGEKYNDAELLARAKDMEVQADMIEEEGMSKGRRKWLRADSYQTQNQQRAQ